MQVRYFSVVLLALMTFLVSPFALAHSGAGHAAGLADGFMHPATGLDHLLIAVAAGFWAGRAHDHGVSGVAYFLSLLLGGMLIGVCCLLFPQLQLSVSLLIVLGGLFVAFSIAAPQYFAYIFFGSFAVYHGMVHMLEIPATATATGYIAGLFLSTGLLMVFGLILRQVVVTRKPHSTVSQSGYIHRG